MGNGAAEIQLNTFGTTPLYNIKAVVQATNISPSTLRAWERRYHMCQPQRSESGYRLYSDRDIAIIRWLKAQVEAGMSISHAVSWLQSLLDKGEDSQTVLLPDPNGRANETTQITAPTAQDVQNFGNLYRRLLGALLFYNEQEAEQVLAEAFALYPVEQVGEHVLAPTMVEVGERWHRNEISVAREHYATSYLMQRLAVILRAVPNGLGGPLIWVACAPGERHEMGALLLCIYLRRAGFQVCYFGQDLAEDDLIAEARLQKPGLILLSASAYDTAENLRLLCEKIMEIEHQRPIVGYGGRIFSIIPELRDRIAGVFAGTSALEAVEVIGDLAAGRDKLTDR